MICRYMEKWSVQRYLIGSKAIKDGNKGESTYTVIYCNVFFDVEVEGYDMVQNDNDQKTFHLGPMSAPIRYVLGVAPLPSNH